MACLSGARTAAEATGAVGDGLAPRTRPGGVGHLTVRNGEKGPVEIEIVTRRVQTRLARKRTGPAEWLVVTRRPLADEGPVEGHASPDVRDQDTRYGYRYYLTPTGVATGDLEEPSLRELARVIKAGTCIEASFQRGKGEAGMDAYQVRTWEGWHHHMALTLIAVWFLISESHRGQQWQGHSVFEFNTNESQCLHRLGGQPAASRRNVGMARPPQEPNGGIAERCHHLRDVATAHLGAVFIECHIAYPVRLVLTCRPMT